MLTTPCRTESENVPSLNTQLREHGAVELSCPISQSDIERVFKILANPDIDWMRSFAKPGQYDAHPDGFSHSVLNVTKDWSLREQTPTYGELGEILLSAPVLELFAGLIGVDNPNELSFISVRAQMLRPGDFHGIHRHDRERSGQSAILALQPAEVGGVQFTVDESEETRREQYLDSGDFVVIAPDCAHGLTRVQEGRLLAISWVAEPKEIGRMLLADRIRSR